MYKESKKKQIIYTFKNNTCLLNIMSNDRPEKCYNE